jgi:hypothetical protein
MIADYLRSETHFATFYCFNTNQGYFEVGNCAPFIPESASPNDPGVSVLNWHLGKCGGGLLGRYEKRRQG